MTGQPAALTVPPSPGRWSPRSAIAGIGTVVGAVALAIIAAVAATAARLFGQPARWFPIVMWGLAFHVAIIAFLVGTLGLPAGLVRIVAAWKEAIAILLLGAVTVRAVLRRGPRSPIAGADVPVVALIALSVAMLIAGQVLFVEQPRPIAMRLYGLRESCFFLTLYFVGRSTPELASDGRVIRQLVVLAAVLSAIALLEAMFVSAETLAVLGVTMYFQDFLGVENMAEGSQFGLPYYYFTLVGGRTVQRAGSVFLSSQGFAISFLLTMPAAVIWLFRERSRATLWRCLVVALLTSGLLVTVTRMATVAAIISILALLVIRRRFDVVALFVAVGFAAVVAAIVVVPGLGEFIWKTLAWQTGSSASHSEDWKTGFLTMMHYPFGSGLGTTDLTPSRFGYNSLTGDNLFLKYGVELGIIGGVTMAGLLAGFGATAYALHRRGATEHERSMGALVFVATLGLTMNGLTAVVFNSTWVAYLYAWLAGSTVTVATLRRHR